MAQQVGELSPDGRWRWDGERWVSAAAADTWIGRVAAKITDLRVARPAGWPVLPLLIVSGALTDMALRSSRVGVAASLLLISGCAGLVLTRRVVNPHGIAALGLAVLLAACLWLRQSPWLLLPDLAAVAALVLVACGIAARGGLFDLSFARAQAHVARALVHVLVGITFVAVPLRAAGARLRDERRSQAIAVLRGVLLATPVVLLLGWLLTQADAVFASFFRFRTDPLDWSGHAILFSVGALAAAGLVRAASAEPMQALPRVGWRLGGIESLVVLVALDMVFAAFTAAQVVAATGAGAAAIRTQGLTYAEYARSGFFQLLWAAGITLVLLLALRTFVDRSSSIGRRAFVVAAELAILFTLLIVAVAFQRLSLYVSVYGLSMLRLYSLVFAGWIALVYGALGVALTRLGERRQWFPAAMVMTGIAGLLALNVANPEALVVRYNLATTAQTQRFDTDYLVTLSADALPALADALPSMDARARQIVRARLCGGPSFTAPDWAGFNWSSLAADEARVRAC